MIERTAQNDWETMHDGDAIWKGWSREAARAYQPIWDKCNAGMLLQEDFEAVIDSRWRQEQGNAPKAGMAICRPRRRGRILCPLSKLDTRYLGRFNAAR